MVTSDFRLKKFVRKRFGILMLPDRCVRDELQPVDRISQLPDEILAYILSFLTLLDAAKTSVLSRRWVSVWMDGYGLNFDAAKMWEGIDASCKSLQVVDQSGRRKYVEWVNKVLPSHKAIHLDFFRIRFDLDYSSKDDIDKWLQYAFAKKRVHRLDLNLCVYGRHVYPRAEESYAFPPDLLRRNPDGFKSLGALTFNSVAVSEAVLEFFLHNCPLLEHLVVVNSHSLEELKVCGSSIVLKHLEIVFCAKLRSLTVCDTNIVSLKVDKGKPLVLKNAPKLVDVYFGQPRCVGRLVYCTLSKLYCCLSNLEFLTLEIKYSQAEQEMRKVKVPQLTNLKQLTIVMLAADDVSLIPFTCLVWSSPSLEKFVLKTDRQLEFGYKNWPHYSKALKPVAFPLRRLKVVEIRGYYGHKNREVGLIKYFIDNGVALERIIIDPRDQLCSGACFPIGSPGLEDPEEEAFFRNVAKKQLQPLVPSNVELVIL